MSETTNQRINHSQIHHKCLLCFKQEKKRSHIHHFYGWYKPEQTWDGSISNEPVLVGG